MITPADLIGPVTDEDIEWACQLLKLQVLDEQRRAFLKSLTTLDVSACPGSGENDASCRKAGNPCAKVEQHYPRHLRPLAHQRGA